MSMSPSLHAAWLLRGLSLLVALSCAAPVCGTPADKSDDKSASSKAKPAAARRKIRLHVTGPDGRPVPKAKIEVSVWSNDKFRPPRSNRTDADGTVDIELPSQLRIVRFWVSADKLVTMFVHWEENEDPEKTLPTDVTIPLESGTEIGGYVVDEDGKPIADAKVSVELESGGKKEEGNRFAYNRWLASEGDSLVTDADGHWSLDNVPAADDIQIGLSVSHPDYISDTSTGKLQRKQGIDLVALRSGDSRFVMQKGIFLTGAVTDPDGKPIPAAAVIWCDQQGMNWGTKVTRTNLNGVYRSNPLPVGKVYVMVIARNWMPETREVELTKDASAVDFQMKPGKHLRLRFVDNRGKPVSNVSVRPRRWRGKEMQFNGDGAKVIEAALPNSADDAGVFEWNWAPEDAVQFEIGKKGFAGIMNAPFAASDSEQKQVLYPILTVTGNVVDAESGEPVDRFAAVQVHYFDPSFLFVNRDEKAVGKDGKFTMQFDRTDIEHGVRIEADGYRTKQIGPWKVGDDNPQIEVKLEAHPPWQAKSSTRRDSPSTVRGSTWGLTPSTPKLLTMKPGRSAIHTFARQKQTADSNSPPNTSPTS